MSKVKPTTNNTLLPSKPISTVTQFQQQQQQLRKKRTALENISNATGTRNSTNTALTNSINNNTITITKDLQKKATIIKPIIGGAGVGIGHNAANIQALTSGISKRTDTNLTNKKFISSSKENLTNLSQITKQKTITTNVGVHKQPIAKTNDSKPQSLSANSIIKTDKNNIELKQQQDALIKIEKVKTETTTTTIKTELLLERKLATTCISASSTSTSISTTTTTNKSDLKEENIIWEDTRVHDEQNEMKLDIDDVDSVSKDIKLKEDQQQQQQQLDVDIIDIEEQKWEDIDKNDNDEFNANDYVTTIFKYYKERENKFQVNDYIRNQPSINRQMRVVLVDWMVEVQQQLEFNHEVLYLSVKLLDLYLNSKLIEKEKLQLLAGASMFIACKFEERMPPIIDDFIYVSDNAYDRKELIKMEIEILKTVRFDIGAPLSYTFLRRYSKCIRADMKFLTLARYILELSLQDYNFAYVKDSLKACASLYLALKMALKYENNLKSVNNNNEQIKLTVTTANLTSTEWNATLVHYTEWRQKDFIHLLPMMNSLLQNASASKYKTVFRKYQHEVFYEVAKVPCLNQAELDVLIQQAAISKY